MKPTLAQMPALPIVIGWIAGICLWWYGMPWWFSAISVAIGASLILTARHYLAIGFFSMAAGWIVAVMNEPSEPPQGLFNGREYTYCGEIIDSELTPTSRSMVVRIDSIGSGNGAMTGTAPFNARLFSLPDWMPEPVGSHITFNAVLEPVEKKTIFPREHNFYLWNLQRGVTATAYLDSDPQLSGNRSVTLKTWLADRRENISALLARSDLSDEAYGLLSALLIGDDDELQESVKENFRVSGIAHALALSGFHVGAVVLLVSLVLYPLRISYSLIKVRYILTIILIWLYAGVVGMPESVVRAVAMMTVYMVGLLSGRDTNPYNALCFAVVFILAIWPYSLFSAGLQLSVCAVLGILLFSEALNPTDMKKHYRLHCAVAVIAVPVAALLGTMPVTVWYFHRLPLYFLLSNVLVTLSLPIVMLSGAVLAAAISMGFQPHWLERLIDFMVYMLDRAVEFIASLPGGEIAGLYLSQIQLVALIAVFCALGYVVLSRRLIGVAVLAGTIAAFAATCVWGGEKIPCSEAFVVGQRGNTPLVFRHGDSVIVSMTCRNEDREHAAVKLSEILEDYFASRHVHTVRYTEDDFVLGPYSRKGDIITFGDKTLALMWRPGQSVSMPGRHDYVMICSRYRGRADELLRAIETDTVVLSRDLTLSRRARIRSQIPDSIAVIDIRDIMTCRD